MNFVTSVFNEEVYYIYIFFQFFICNSQISSFRN